MISLIITNRKLYIISNRLIRFLLHFLFNTVNKYEYCLCLFIILYMTHDDISGQLEIKSQRYT